MCDTSTALAQNGLNMVYKSTGSCHFQVDDFVPQVFFKEIWFWLVYNQVLNQATANAVAGWKFLCYL